MAKIFGGSASRLEVYALFVAAVVLIGGGVAGAVVVSSSDSKPAEVAQVSVDTTTVDTTVVETTVPPAPDGTTSPTATAQRYYNPEPQAPVTSYPNQPVQTVAPQPIQDYSAYCIMPNLVGLRGQSGIDNTFRTSMENAGCRLPAPPVSYCLDPNLDYGGFDNFEIRSQSPAAGTMIHRTLGTYSLVAGYYPYLDSWRPYGENPC